MAKAYPTSNAAPIAARRGVLLGALMTLAGSKTATAVVPPSDTVQSVDAAASALSAAIGRLHGGVWRITVNHDQGFILIVQNRGARVAGGAQ
jgi:hypothetical protein